MATLLNHRFTPADGVIRWLSLEDFILRENGTQSLELRIADINQVHGFDEYQCRLPAGLIRAFSIDFVDCPNPDIFTLERFYDRSDTKRKFSFEYEITVSNQLLYRGTRNQYETMLPFVRILPSSCFGSLNRVEIKIKGNQSLREIQSEGRLRMMVLLVREQTAWFEPIRAYLARGVLWIPWGLMKYDMPNYLLMNASGAICLHAFNDRYRPLTSEQISSNVACACWRCRGGPKGEKTDPPNE